MPSEGTSSHPFKDALVKMENIFAATFEPETWDDAFERISALPDHSVKFAKLLLLHATRPHADPDMLNHAESVASNVTALTETLAKLEHHINDVEKVHGNAMKIALHKLNSAIEKPPASPMATRSSSTASATLGSDAATGVAHVKWLSSLASEVQRHVLSPLEPFNIFKTHLGIEASKCHSEAFADAEVLLLLGTTGAGKSTLALFLAGCKMENVAADAGYTHYDAVTRPQDSFSEIRVARNVTRSETKHVSPFPLAVRTDSGDDDKRKKKKKSKKKAENAKRIGGDAPGFLDTEGAEVAVSNGVGVQLAVEHAMSVIPVLVVDGRTSGKWQTQIPSIEAAANMFQDEEALEKFCFVFTFIKEDSNEAIQLRAAIKELEEKLAQDQQNSRFSKLVSRMRACLEDDECYFPSLGTDDPADILENLFLPDIPNDPDECVEYPGDVIIFTPGDGTLQKIKRQLQVMKERINCALELHSFALVASILEEAAILSKVLPSESFIEDARSVLLSTVSEFVGREFDGMLDRFLSNLHSRDPMNPQLIQECLELALAYKEAHWLPKESNERGIAFQSFQEMLESAVGCFESTMEKLHFPAEHVSIAHAINKLEVIRLGFDGTELNTDAMQKIFTNAADWINKSVAKCAQDIISAVATCRGSDSCIELLQRLDSFRSVLAKLPAAVLRDDYAQKLEQDFVAQVTSCVESCMPQWRQLTKTIQQRSSSTTDYVGEDGAVDAVEAMNRFADSVISSELAGLLPFLRLLEQLPGDLSRAFHLESSQDELIQTKNRLLDSISEQASSLIHAEEASSMNYFDRFTLYKVTWTSFVVIEAAFKAAKERLADVVKPFKKTLELEFQKLSSDVLNTCMSVLQESVSGTTATSSHGQTVDPFSNWSLDDVFSLEQRQVTEAPQSFGDKLKAYVSLDWVNSVSPGLYQGGLGKIHRIVKYQGDRLCQFLRSNEDVTVIEDLEDLSGVINTISICLTKLEHLSQFRVIEQQDSNSVPQPAQSVERDSQSGDAVRQARRSTSMFDNFDCTRTSYVQKVSEGFRRKVSKTFLDKNQLESLSLKQKPLKSSNPTAPTTTAVTATTMRSPIDEHERESSGREFQSLQEHAEAIDHGRPAENEDLDDDAESDAESMHSALDQSITSAAQMAQQRLSSGLRARNIATRLTRLNIRGLSNNFCAAKILARTSHPSLKTLGKSLVRLILDKLQEDFQYLENEVIESGLSQLLMLVEEDSAEPIEMDALYQLINGIEVAVVRISTFDKEQFAELREAMTAEEICDADAIRNRFTVFQDLAFGFLEEDANGINQKQVARARACLRPLAKLDHIFNFQLDPVNSFSSKLKKCSTLITKEAEADDEQLQGAVKAGNIPLIRQILKDRKYHPGSSSFRVLQGTFKTEQHSLRRTVEDTRVGMTTTNALSTTAEKENEFREGLKAFAALCDFESLMIEYSFQREKSVEFSQLSDAFFEDLIDPIEKATAALRGEGWEKIVFDSFMHIDALLSKERVHHLRMVSDFSEKIEDVSAAYMKASRQRREELIDSLSACTVTDLPGISPSPTTILSSCRKLIDELTKIHNLAWVPGQQADLRRFEVEYSSTLRRIISQAVDDLDSNKDKILREDPTCDDFNELFTGCRHGVECLPESERRAFDPQLQRLGKYLETHRASVIKHFREAILSRDARSIAKCFKTHPDKQQAEKEIINAIDGEWSSTLDAFLQPDEHNPTSTVTADIIGILSSFAVMIREQIYDGAARALQHMLRRLLKQLLSVLSKESNFIGTDFRTKGFRPTDSSAQLVAQNRWKLEFVLFLVEKLHLLDLVQDKRVADLFHDSRKTAQEQQRSGLVKAKSFHEELQAFLDGGSKTEQEARKAVEALCSGHPYFEALQLKSASFDSIILQSAHSSEITANATPSLMSQLYPHAQDEQLEQQNRFKANTPPNAEREARTIRPDEQGARTSFKQKKIDDGSSETSNRWQGNKGGRGHNRGKQEHAGSKKQTHQQPSGNNNTANNVSSSSHAEDPERNDSNPAPTPLSPSSHHFGTPTDGLTEPFLPKVLRGLYQSMEKANADICAVNLSESKHQLSEASVESIHQTCGRKVSTISFCIDLQKLCVDALAKHVPLTGSASATTTELTQSRGEKSNTLQQQAVAHINKQLEEFYFKGVRAIESDLITESDQKQLDESLRNLQAAVKFFSKPAASPEPERNLSKLKDKAIAWIKKLSNSIDEERNPERKVDQIIELHVYSLTLSFLQKDIQTVLEKIFKGLASNSSLFKKISSAIMGHEQGALLISSYKVFDQIQATLRNTKLRARDAKSIISDSKIIGDTRKTGIFVTSNEPEILEKEVADVDDALNDLIRRYLFCSRSNIRDLVRETNKEVQRSKGNGFAKGNVLLNLAAHARVSVIAHVFGLWVVERSKSLMDSTGQSQADGNDGNDYLVRPHPGQILAVIRMLASPQGGLDNNFVQVGTGEGKSIVLGTVASILALYGMEVDVVCYSQHLSNRDYAAFKFMFDLLEVTPYIKYGTFPAVCERILNSEGNVRNAVTAHILGNNGATPKPKPRLGSGSGSGSTSSSSNSSSWRSQKSRGHRKGRHFGPRKRVLLIDEVDVFFHKSFFGALYTPSSCVQDPSITELVKKIWDLRRTKPKFNVIESLPEYAACLQRFAKFHDLVISAVRNMVIDMAFFESHEYEVHQDRIGYKDQDRIVYNMRFGYQTMFAYFLENERGKISSESLEKNIAIYLNCGNFSYAEIPMEFYNRVLGVTGTLEVLSDFENKVMEKKYQVHRRTIIGSAYGQSKLQFASAGNGVVVVKRGEHYREIINRISEVLRNGRAVIVFFESETDILQFKESEPGKQLPSKFQIMVESLNAVERETAVQRASLKGMVTLATRVYGRGFDFVTNDESVNEKGGVEVITTFLSMEESEEVQIKGRTARQGNHGSFTMILCEEDLEEFDISSEEIADGKDAGELYQLLRKKATAKFTEEYKQIEEHVTSALVQHKKSQTFRKNLLRHRDDAAFLAFLEAENPVQSHGLGGPARVMILLDATGSMSNALSQTKTKIATMLDRAEEILRDAGGNKSFMLSLLVYRNYNSPAEKLLEQTPWTNRPHEIQQRLLPVRVSGGWGNEAIEAALQRVNKENIQTPVASVVLIGDAPPNSPEEVRSKREGRGEGYWQSCPDFATATTADEEIRKFPEYGTKLHSFYVAGRAKAGFEELAHETGGVSHFLDLSSSENALTDIVSQIILASTADNARESQALVAAYNAKFGAKKSYL